MSPQQIISFIHEFRQPLYVQGLLISQLSGSVHESSTIADLIRTNQAMHLLLQQLRLWISPSADKVTPRHQAIPVNSLFDSIKEELPDPETAFYFLPSNYLIYSDPQILRQILIQFARNAIQHAPEARWLAGCRRTREGIRIDVLDTGPGIPDHIAHAGFAPFTKAVAADNQNLDTNLGLGLSIAGQFAALLGHRIEIQSMANRGTRASIFVPRYMPNPL